jgi:hypothetical protein
MKQDTLFRHKEFAVTYEYTMVDAEDYQKLLKPLKKPKKAPNNTHIKKMCDFYHKPRHLKECCHWNPKNLDKKLKNKKKVLVNEVSLHAGKGTSENHRKQGNQNQGSFLVYHCFICNSLEHKINDCPHNLAAQEMF